jgi:hypothetical protein
VTHAWQRYDLAQIGEVDIAGDLVDRTAVGDQPSVLAQPQDLATGVDDRGDLVPVRSNPSPVHERKD